MIDCQWDRPQVTETTVECTINDTTTWIGGGEEEGLRLTQSRKSWSKQADHYWNDGNESSSSSGDKSPGCDRFSNYVRAGGVKTFWC